MWGAVAGLHQHSGNLRSHSMVRLSSYPAGKIPLRPISEFHGAFNLVFSLIPICFFIFPFLNSRIVIF